MPVISGGVIMPGGLSGYQSAGAPSAGTNEVQTLTIGGTPTAGTFTFTREGRNTAAITWSAVNATLLAAINAALDAIGTAGDIVATAGTLTAGIGTVTLTYGGTLARMAVSTLTATSALTGTAPTLAVAETTPGVDATGRGAAIGAQLTDITNGILYINTGTTYAPTWTKVGTQT
jgi:hypothetical protein